MWYAFPTEEEIFMSGKDKWSSKFGFIMASAGSAVGLGNLWKFPYMASRHGGGMFLLFYVIFALMIGVPVLLSELAIGRYAGKNAVDSCRAIAPKWGFAGMLGILGSLFVLAFYGTVGGWVIKYFLLCLADGLPSSDFFVEYTSHSAEPVIYQLIFCLICGAIVAFGVSGGIEKASKLLLPLLLIFLTAVMLYTLRLPGAAEGARFFLLPDLAAADIKLHEIIIAAMGQMFFSLSLGMGTLITYGSYLSKNSDLPSSAVTIVVIDTIIAVIAGLAVIPAVYAAGLEPDAGPGLIFVTLPAVFGRMSGGRYIAAAFFFLVLIAAITSAVSLIEVIASFVGERMKLSRPYAVTVSTAASALLGIPASLSSGVLKDVRIGGLSMFELPNFLADNIIMPLGAVSICLLTGRIWGMKNAAREMSIGSRTNPKMFRILGAILNYAAPAVIIIVFISSLTGLI